MTKRGRTSPIILAYSPHRPLRSPSMPCAAAGRADVLAGEASANNVNCSNVGAFEFRNVVMDGDARPVLGEDFPAERIDLTEGNGSHSGSFEPETESANS
jgi:hypothetical protein